MEYTVIGNIILLKFHPEIQPVEKLTGFRFDNRAKSDTINGVNTLLQVVQFKKMKITSERLIIGMILNKTVLLSKYGIILTTSR